MPDCRIYAEKIMKDRGSFSGVSGVSGNPFWVGLNIPEDCSL